jgi:hypothetical protein
MGQGHYPRYLAIRSIKGLGYTPSNRFTDRGAHRVADLVVLGKMFLPTHGCPLPLENERIAKAHQSRCLSGRQIAVEEWVKEQRLE